MQAASYGASAELQHIRHGAVVVNDAALHDRLVGILTPRLGSENVDPVGFKEMASEDFAFCGDCFLASLRRARTVRLLKDRRL